MHRDKTVARIFLVNSVVHGALAAPVVVRQRYLDVVEDVLTTALEKRDLDNESPHPGSVVSIPLSDSEESVSYLAPEDSELGDSYFTRRSSPSVSNRYLTTPVLGTLQMRDDLPATTGTLTSQGDPPPALGTPRLHNDPPPTSGTPPLRDNPSPASGDPQLHIDPTTSTLGTPQEAEGFFNDARMKKLKLYGGFGLGVTAAIVGAGLLYASDKLIKPLFNNRDLASSDGVDRGASMHPRSPQNRFRVPSLIRGLGTRISNC